MPSVTRRRAVQAIASLPAWAALAGRAVASHPDAVPEHVSLEFDKAILEAYRPRLQTANLSVKPNALYAWSAYSAEYDLDWHVYWASYSHQEGVSGIDSHYGDHEPCYVGVDSESGEVEQIIYSGYHWLAARAPRSAITFDGQHPCLDVIEPWHQYALASEAEGQLVAVKDLGAAIDDADSDQTAFEAWLANGLEEDLDVGSVVNPQTMTRRPDWWATGTAGLPSLNNIYVRALLAAGFRGADASDTSRIVDQ